MLRKGGHPSAALARLPSRAAHRILSQVGGPGATNKTYGCHWTVPLSTRALVFVHANYLTDETFRVEAAYAPSSALGNFVDPEDAEGAPAAERLFRQVTWNGGQTVGEVPPAANPKVPSLVASDAMPFVPLPRRDGGDGALLLFRNFAPGHQNADFYDGALSRASAGGYGFGGGWYNENEHTEMFPHVRAGRFGAATGHGFGLLEQVSPHALIAVTDRPVVSILHTGDSVNSGISADDGLLNPAMVAARALTARTGVLATSVNEAVSGDVSANYIARASAALRVMNFSVALVQCYSRNDQVVFGDTMDTAMAAYTRAILFAAECLDAGVIPILETATPFAGAPMHGGDFDSFEPVRVAMNAVIRQSGFAVLDYDRILGTGSSPNAYRPDLSEDGIHPNTAAIERLGQQAGAIMAALLQLSTDEDTAGQPQGDRSAGES